MLYDAYESKIRRRYHYIKLIHRFRVLIITAIAIITSLTTLFFITKGMVFSVKYEKQVSYGNTINIKSNGFLSNETYSYRLKGSSSFTNELPKNPGEYEVKITTIGAFSNIKEKIVPFTIKAKDININVPVLDLEFGSMPYDINLKLEFDDYIDEIDFEYLDPGKESSVVKLSHLVIKNKEGLDVTKFYNIDFETKEINIVKRKVTLELLNYQGVYNGLKQNSNSYKVIGGSLISGHYAKLTTSGNYSNVGLYDNKILDIKIYDDKDNDVTINYEITSVDKNSKIEILKRDLTLELLDVEKAYDSKPLTSNTLKEINENQLLSNHKVSVKTSKSIKNYGTITNMIDEVLITDDLGNDVTNNYNIKTFNGKLNITKHKIYLKTGSSKKIYDGNIFNDLNFSHIDGTLFNNEELIVYKDTKVINANTYDNVLEVLVYENNIISNNYEIVYEYGLLEIEKREITIETKSSSKVYDSLNFEYGVFDISKEGLADLEYLEIFYENIVDVGIHENKFNVKVKNNNNLDTTNNYEISYLYGRLEITKKVLEVKTNTLEKVYDGLTLSSTDVSFSDSYGVNDHYSIINTSEILNVGEILNEITIKFYNQNLEDKTDNYQIIYNYGLLSVNKRPIHIAPSFNHKVYDGTELVSVGFDYIKSDYSLLIDNTITFLTDGSLINAGITDNNIIESSISIKDMFGNELKDNYEITLYSNSLVISKRDITIKTLMRSKIYDGIVLTENKVETTILSLYQVLDNHHINAITDGAIINVGIKENEIISHVILDDLDNDVTENYQTSYELGILEIKERPITLKSSSDAKVYDGLDFSNKTFLDVDSSLVIGEEIEVSYNTVINNVNKVSNILDYKIYNKDYEDVTSNYLISYIEGTLEVMPREITIKPVDKSKIYDGNVFYLEEDDYEYNNSLYELASGHQLKISVLTYLIDVGIETVNISNYLITNSDLEDVTNNYIVNLVSGTIEILVRPITYQYASDTKSYDSYYFFNDNYQIKEGSLAINENIRINDDSHMYKYVNVGIYQNDYEFKIFTLYDKDVTSNYDITYQYGSLEITIVDLEVKSNSREKVYDGIPLFDYEVIINKGRIMDRDHLSNVTYNEITNVGFILNILKFEIRSVDRDATTNYNITYEYGTLVVSSREITIKPVDLSKIYDGEILFSNDVIIDSNSKYDLIYNHRLLTKTSGEITNVGSVESKITSYEIYDENDIIQTSNYSVIIVDGILEITKRPIIIKPKDLKKVYDGLELSGSILELDSNSPYQMVLDHMVIGNTEGFITDVGIETNRIISHTIVDSLNNDLSFNYDCTYEVGTLEVTLRKIIVESNSNSKVYDGLELYELGFNIQSGNLVLDHKIEVLNHNNLIEVGSIYNILEYLITDSLNNNKTNNYEIINSYGLLSISKRELTIKLDNKSKEYDGLALTSDTVSVFFGNLVLDHYVVVKANGNIINVGTKDNNITSHKILDLDLNDKTNNYEVKYQSGTLTIKTRDIYLESNSSSKVYDGMPYYDLGYKIFSGEGPVLNDKIVVSANYNLIDVGSIFNQLKYVITNEKDEDISYNYLFVIRHGTLEITPREITIKPEDITKYYDGKPLSSNLLIVSPNSENDLVLDHRVVGNTEGFITDIGKTNNIILSHKIIDLNDNDISSNYSVSYEEGTLSVIKAIITLKLLDKTKVYDGILFESNEVEEIELINTLGYTILVNTFSDAINVGTHNNKIISHKIFDSNSIDVSINFEVIYIDGNLEITKREITVRSNSNTFVYNRLDHSDSKFEVINGNLVVDDLLVVTSSNLVRDVGIYENYQEYQVLNNKDLVITENYDIKKVLGELEVVKGLYTISSIYEDVVYNGTNNFYLEIEDSISRLKITITLNDTVVKTYNSYYLNKVEIYDLYNNNLSNNYNFEISPYNEINVIKRDATLEPNTKTKAYDGLPLTSNEVKQNNLASNHYALIYTDGSITGIGETINNIISYYIFNQNGLDVTSNYQVTLKEGKLEVVLGLLEIKTKNYSVTYDGTYHSYNEIEIVKGKLASNHIINVLTSESFIDSGRYENNIQSFEITDLLGNDVSDRYNVTLSETLGIIEILPRPITIQTGSSIKVYDKESIENKYFYEVGNSLLSSDSIELSSFSSFINAGTYTNIHEYKIMNGSSDITSNYLINVIYGTILIEKRKVSIKVVDKDKIYDGEYFRSTDNFITNDYYNLLAGDMIDIETDGLIKDVGTANNGIISHNIIDSNKKNQNNNYEVYYISGTLEVKKRPITIKLNDVTYIYDGNVKKDDNYTITSELDIVEKHSIRLETTGGLIDVGYTVNTIKNHIILDESSIDVTNNYDVKYESGSIEVTKRIIEIKPTDLEKPYDGLALIPENITIINNTFLVKNHVIIGNMTGSQTNIGSSFSNIISIMILDDNGIDKTHNYEAIFREGSLTVTKVLLEISVKKEIKNYDGTPLYGSTPEVKGNITEGDRVFIETNGEIIYPGVVSNEITSYYILDINGNDVTDNYDALLTAGELIIRQKITIQVMKYVKTYDGLEKSFKNTDFYYPNSNEKLPSGYEIRLNISGYIKDAGEIISETNVSEISKSGIDYTDYFDVNIIENSYTISKRKITVRTDSVTKFYDEEELTSKDYDITRGQLLNGDLLNLVFSDSSKITDPGQVLNKVLEEETTIINEDGRYVTNNYEITYEYGILEVKASNDLLYLDTNQKLNQRKVRNSNRDTIWVKGD